MRKIIDKIHSDGIDITFEYDTEENIYILTVKKQNETKIFEGTIEEIQQMCHKYFVKSLKSIKNQLEVLILEEIYKKS